jgi:transposase
MRLTGRRAVHAASTGQRQLPATVSTSPGVVRARFRGQTTRGMIATAARLRPGADSGDVEMISCLKRCVARELYRRLESPSIMA